MTTETARARLLETFLHLVRIDSPTTEEAACARYCADALRAAGCRVTFDDSAARTGSDTGNLVAELPGGTDAVLLLSAHMDVVEPCRGVEPVIQDGIVFSAGETVLGADDKAGLAAAIECVRRLAETDAPAPTVRCLFTVQEEVGLRGAKELADDAVKGDMCLVLDADGTPGGIVTAAPTHYTFKAAFIGKASHAGVAPESGISAIVMAADAISAIPVGRLDELTTANVGTIEGGSATNVITPRVDLTGECRSLDRARVEDVKAAMDAAMRQAADKHGGSVDIAWTLEYDGFRNAEDDPRLALVMDAVRDCGREPRTFSTGGGSDANVISALGVPTFALSCGMAGVHGVGEQIEIADLEALADICEAVARRLARQGEATR